MNFAVRVLLASAFFSLSPSILGQGAQQLLEEVKRLAGEVADLRDANSAQTRRIAQMQSEIDNLRQALRDSHERSTSKLGDFATREDLKKIVDSIRDVDRKREADRSLILGEFEKLGKTLAAAPVERSSSRRAPKEPEAAPIEGTFLPYKVKDGQRLFDILKEYNDALKAQGLPAITLDQVRRANPKLNINRIFVGQEILLPVPEKR
jgi:TolA-binding protein